MEKFRSAGKVIRSRCRPDRKTARRRRPRTEAPPASFEPLEARALLSATAMADSYTAAQGQTLVIRALGEDRLIMRSEAGDFIGVGRNYSYDERTSVFQSEGLGNGRRVAIRVEQGISDYWHVTMAAPIGELLLPGRYLDATESVNDGGPSLEVSGQSRGSNQIEGNFTIHQALFDDRGIIVNFLADFEQHSEGKDPALFGTIEYNAAPNPAASVLGNDIAPTSATAVLAQGPAHGVLQLNADGTFSYTPHSGFYGQDSFVYRVFDGVSYSAPAVATINVVEGPPIVQDLVITSPEDVVVEHQLPPIDPEGDAVIFNLFRSPKHGSVQFNADGSFVYTPNANYHGPDHFEYKATDGIHTTEATWVDLIITSVLDAPAAVNNDYVVQHDQVLDVIATGHSRLSMVSDEGDYVGDGRTHNFNEGTGSFLVNRDTTGWQQVGVFYKPADLGYYDWSVYMAAPNFTTLTEGHYDQVLLFPAGDPSHPGLRVSGEGRGPSDITGQFTVHQVVYAADGRVLNFLADFEQHNRGAEPALRGRVEFNATLNPEAGVLGNDTDGDGDFLTASMISGPANGSIIFRTDGTFTYTPRPGFAGADTFTYRAYDGKLYSDPTTVTIDVLNQTPVADAAQVSGDEDSAIQGSVSGDDGDGDAVTFALAAEPAHGTVQLNPNGTFTYSPAANFHGQDSFAFAATDGMDDSDLATVQITVNPVNDAPGAVGESFRIRQAGNIALPAPGLLSNDSDVDGDLLSTIVQTGPNGGTLSLNADGSMIYSALPGFTGIDSFVYLVSDGGLQTPATVSIEIVPFLAPSGLAGDVQGSNVSLTWLDNTGGFAQTFQIERAAKPKGKNGTPSWQLVGMTSSAAFVESNVSGGTWLYRVRAVADNIVSGYSNTVELRIGGTKGGGGKKNRTTSLSSSDLLMRDSLANFSTKRTAPGIYGDQQVIDLFSIVSTTRIRR